ncbi:MAG: hypothetical protein AAF551_10760, partial [Bacteroidota bacterium]
NLPNSVKNKVGSFSLKGNCLLTSYDLTGAIRKTGATNRRCKNSTYVLNIGNRSWESIRLTCWDKTDVNLVAYEHSNYSGAPLPIWDNFLNRDFPPKWGWDTRISSLDLNTHDYTEGIQIGRFNNELEYTRMMAFFDVSRLPEDVNDKIARIVLGRRYGKRCNPRNACYDGAACTGTQLVPQNFAFGGTFSPQECARALNQVGVNRNSGSYCSATGFCYNPRTAQGYP